MRMLSAILLCFLLLLAVGCTEVHESDVDDELQEMLYEQIRKDINVTLDFQHFDGDRQKLVIWVENNGEYTFSGKLSMTVRGTSDEFRGTGTLTVDKLGPGEKTYAIMWLRANTGFAGTGGYRWSDYTLEK